MALYEAHGTPFLFGSDVEVEFHKRFEDEFNELQWSKPVSSGIGMFMRKVHDKILEERKILEAYRKVLADNFQNRDFWMMREHETERAIARKTYELQIVDDAIHAALKYERNRNESPERKAQALREAEREAKKMAKKQGWSQKWLNCFGL